MTHWIEARFERLERRMTFLEGALQKLTGTPIDAGLAAEPRPAEKSASNPRREAFERWQGGVIPGADVDERGARITPEAIIPAQALPPAEPVMPLIILDEEPGDAEAPPTKPFWPELRPPTPPAELPAADGWGMAATKAAPTQTKSSVDLEVRIGTRWVAWVAALCFVVGIAFGLKYAYDFGYLQLTPVQKCGAAAGIGALLLAAGELCLRRFGRIAAVSLFASGLGVLYLTAFAAHHTFNLLDRGAAFGLLSLVALVGVGLTLRARMLTIGLISLVGGYAAPILMNGAAVNAMALPSYATVLLSIALGLSWHMAAPFRPLRYWGLGLHAVLCTLWMASIQAAAWPVAAGFMTLWWAMVTLESLAAARKNESSSGNAAASFLATAWLASAGCWLLAAHASREWLGAYTFALAGVTGAIAAFCGAGVAALRERPTHALAKLAVSLWVQCGVLLASAIAVQFHGDGLEGVGRTMGWLTLALGAFELARFIRSRGVQVFGCFIGALALLQLLSADMAHAAVRDPRWTLGLGEFGEFRISVWSLIALYAVAVMVWTAARIRSGDSERRSVLAQVLATAAWIGWLGVAAASASGMTVTLLWIAPIPLLLTFDRMRPDLRLLAVTPLLLAAGAMRWLAIDAIGGAAGGASAAMWPIVNPQLLAAALIIGCMWMVGRAMGRQPEGAATGTRREWATLVPISTWFFSLIALSFELSRMLNRMDLTGVPSAALWPAAQWHFLWIAVLWSAGAFGMLLEGRRSGFAALVASGWGVLLVAAVAWLTLGTALPRVMNDVVVCTPVLNVQFAAGVLIAALMLIAARLTMHSRELKRSTAELGLVFGLAAAIGLWLGTLELDRAVAYAGSAFAQPGVVRQTAFSVYWGVYAITLIAIGFARSATWFRRAGLALLGITLLKVVLIDMADAGTMYRVLSFLALGVVLIVTSVMYGRLSQKLLQPSGKAEAAPLV